MKINLKKTLAITTILSTSIATIGISSFIVGGYGNNINTLPEIQNSGFFGINTAFEKERTTDYDTKEMYVNHLKANLQVESNKIGSPEYIALTEDIKVLEQELTKAKNDLKPLELKVKNAQIQFDKNKSDSNKKILNDAKAELENAQNSELIFGLEKSIQENNAIITKINQSKDDISRLNNYTMWDSLFITGASLFAIGTIVAITATSYSIYLKKSAKKANE